MVAGYDSTHSISTALRNTFLLWTLYGMALIVFGLLGFTVNPLSEAAGRAERMLDAVVTGGTVFLLFTFVLCGAWVAKSVPNVRRLGRKASIGILSRLRRHLLAFCLGFMALIFGLIVPGLALLFFLLAFALFFYSQLWFHLVILDVVRMLWRGSSPPNGQQEDVDHYVLVWFWSWVFFFSCLTGEYASVDITLRAFAGLAVVAGMACVVSALLASRLVMEISKRQDARLYAIIREVDEDYAPPVTDQDIAAAWNRSAGMIEMPH